MIIFMISNVKGGALGIVVIEGFIKNDWMFVFFSLWWSGGWM